MNKLLQDLRFGTRLLIKRPGFTLVAIITLALGVGANTAIFSVVNAVLLRPLPYPDSERLFTMRSNQSVPDLDDIKAQNQSFQFLGGSVLQALDFTGEAEPVQVQAALCTEDLFDALGVKAAIGRTISPDEARFGGERVVVLSHAFWQKHFSGDPNIIGKTIPLSGNGYSVIGVMPRGFTMPQQTPDVWASVRVVNPLAAQFRGVHFLRTFLRLKPDTTLDQARAEMEGIDRWLSEKEPAENKDRRTIFIPLHERVVGSSRTALYVLLGAVGLVLLIACANFANLLLARAASREQEFVVRAALGAGRSRLVRQMLTESVLLSVIGGASGLLLATWGIDLLLSLKPANLPRLAEIGIDMRVLAFTLGVSVATGLLFGLVPALGGTRMNLNEALKEGGRGSTGSAASRRVRSFLVVSEIALALVLLIGAGLLIKSFHHLQSVEPGFNSANLLTMRVELPESRYREIPKQTLFRQQVLDAMNSLPGVQAAMVSELPMGGDLLTHNFIIDGRDPLAVGDEPELVTRSVSRDYFKTMGIPLLAGRGFSAQDNADAPMVAVINQSMVREYFANQDPIGARFRWARGNPYWITIVGVVGDVKHFGFGVAEQPAAYTAYEQLDQPWKRWMTLVIRGESDQSTLLGQVKSQLWAVDPLLPVTRVQSMTEVMAASLAEQRFNMTLLGIFAAVALTLAAVGIYGVMSYSVTQRTHEIGVRMALGADRGNVVTLVLRQGLLLTSMGVGAGLAAALGLTRVMSSLLFGVSATDPLTFAIISLLLAGVALAACFVPARRATKVDPLIALRYE
ncbi:MAG TPA: ABC transporter permease [Blastocatellia bacterium]|nr:ABC transporter permease [Blastocatellia bacterium]